MRSSSIAQAFNRIGEPEGECKFSLACCGVETQDKNFWIQRKKKWNSIDYLCSFFSFLVSWSNGYGKVQGLGYVGSRSFRQPKTLEPCNFGPEIRKNMPSPSP